MEDKNKELDDLLSQLKNDQGLNSLMNRPSATEDNVNDENVNDFVIKNSSVLITNGLKTIDALTDAVVSSDDPEQLASYSTLIKSIVDAIDTLNKINIQNKKAKTAKELKTMDVNSQAQLGPAQHNTNVLVMTREEIIKNFLEQNKELKKIKDVTDIVEIEREDKDIKNGNQE